MFKNFAQLICLLTGMFHATINNTPVFTAVLLFPDLLHKAINDGRATVQQINELMITCFALSHGSVIRRRILVDVKEISEVKPEKDRETLRIFWKSWEKIK
jgi:hypothetical protein